MFDDRRNGFNAKCAGNVVFTVGTALRGGEAGERCSFAAGTKVIMANGSAKPIDKIKINDSVKATDPERGTTVARPVIALHDDLDTDMADVAVTSNGHKHSTLHTTQNHSFWDATTAQWTRADKLRPGDRLKSLSGATVIVEKVHTFTQAADRYNLTVDQLHTYYVLAGTTPVLVHNTCGPVANSKADDLAFEQMAADFEGVTKLSAGTPEFTQAAAGDGSYLWTVGESGDLNMVRSSPGIHHTIASDGEPVMAAGQITFNGGRVTSFDNMTGHYTPTPECACVFIQGGVDAFAGQGVRVPRNVIRDYGGMAP